MTDRPTNQLTDQPTNQRTDRQGHREVSLPIVNVTASILKLSKCFKSHHLMRFRDQQSPLADPFLAQTLVRPDWSMSALQYSDWSGARKLTVFLG